MSDFRDSAPEEDVELALAVIDATLAGEPVAPEDADLAELTLLLVGERPAIRPEFARGLDERARERFGSTRPAPRSRRLVPWLPAAVGALAAAVVAAVLVLPRVHLGAGAARSAASSSAAAVASRPSVRAAAKPLSKTPASPAHGTSSTPTANSSLGSAGASGSAAASGSALAPAPAPPTTGRQVIQSAAISLATTPHRVDSVAQAVFSVAAQVHAVVETSTVTSTGTPAGSAQIQLSVPGANLETAMSSLSAIPGAAVVSRTDSSQDVTGEAGGLGRRLADARALRSSLLRQLAAATTTAQIDSLQARLHDVEGQISSDQGKLDALHRQVDNSQVSVQIAATLPAGQGSSGGFTIHRALHDAGRVLVVAAGVALIAAAVLVPVGLAAALVAALRGALLRRRREHALDLI